MTAAILLRWKAAIEASMVPFCLDVKLEPDAAQKDSHNSPNDGGEGPKMRYRVGLSTPRSAKEQGLRRGLLKLF